MHLPFGDERLMIKRMLQNFMICLSLLCAAGCMSSVPDYPTSWYYVGCKLEDSSAPGGFGPCNNFPKECKDDGPGPAGQLSLIAYPDTMIDFGKHKAMVVRLANRTDKVIAFAACDSRLYLVQEALTDFGQWRAVEQFPHTFCGNSYHRVFLEPGEYWELYALPQPGTFKTKLRYRLEPGGEQGIAKGGEAIYSNEFEGSIRVENSLMFLGLPAVAVPATLFAIGLLASSSARRRHPKYWVALVCSIQPLPIALALRELGQFSPYYYAIWLISMLALVAGLVGLSVWRQTDDG
jgi:hypothetical protein